MSDVLLMSALLALYNALRAVLGAQTATERAAAEHAARAVLADVDRRLSAMEEE